MRVPLWRFVRGGLAPDPGVVIAVSLDIASLAVGCVRDFVGFVVVDDTLLWRAPILGTVSATTCSAPRARVAISEGTALNLRVR